MKTGHQRRYMMVFAIVGLVPAGWSRAGDEACCNGAVSDGIREAEISQAARELVELAKVEGSDQAAIASEPSRGFSIWPST